MHIADRGDGTFANPIMPNAHWSDPSAICVGGVYYCVTSSAETCPIVQVLRSDDLVNWAVIGSVSRFWPEGSPEFGNWSPRISYVNKKFIVCGHNSPHYFRMFAADQPEGPYMPLDHNIKDMYLQWSPSIFVDDDGAPYMLAYNWVQRLSPDCLTSAGPRHIITTGFLENPCMIKKDGCYYWLCSENGTDTWGLQDHRGKISAWRCKEILGDYEKSPLPLVRSNLDFQCVNTGSAVKAPDGTYWFIYNAFQVTRPSLCRQMILDRIDWTEDGWPYVKRAGSSYTKPISGYAPTTLPDLSDEFDGEALEGITAEPLGSKWLFKREAPGSWSLTERPGFLRMKVLSPSIEHMHAANLLMQRPASAYYSIETYMEFERRADDQHAGITIRELQSQCGVAIGIKNCWIRSVILWHNQGKGLVEVTRVPFEKLGVYLKIDVEGPVIRCFYKDDMAAPWVLVGSEYYITIQSGYFTTFHPGLFAGETVDYQYPAYADFDYFRHTDLEPLAE